LLAVAKYSAKRGIHFQNAAIELANPDSDCGRFKHRPKTQIAVIIACRRKLGDHVHYGTVLKNFRFQVSGKQSSEAGHPSPRCDPSREKVRSAFPRMNRANLIRENCSAKPLPAKCGPSRHFVMN